MLPNRLPADPVLPEVDGVVLVLVELEEEVVESPRAGEAPEGASETGSFIICRNKGWLALISCKRLGCCSPICDKTACNACGFD